eukprot:gene26040-31887_t
MTYNRFFTQKTNVALGINSAFQNSTQSTAPALKQRWLVKVGAAQPDKVQETASDWGISEEERFVVENGVRIDLHDWIKSDWDADWWEKSDEDYVDPIKLDPPEPVEELDEVDEISETYVKVRQELEYCEYEADQAVVGMFKQYPITNDIRILNRTYRNTKEWTHEEILAFIGEPHWDPLTTQCPKARNSFEDLCPSVPETHEWLEQRGMILEEEPTPEGEVLLQADFSDFDSDKVTKMDINAFDIGEEEEDAS